MKIEIKKLSFNYNPRSPEVLKNINLHINSGEVIAFMGASGTGKSTLIKLLLSFLKPSCGGIYFDNKQVTQINSFDRIAYVSQSSTKTLFPWLTVEENLYYPNKLRGTLNLDNKVYCNDLLAKLKLTHKKSCYPLQLSGGEQKRLTLAIAFSYNPKLFFLDEPFSGIDSQLTEELWDILYSYFTKNKPTVIFATHSIDEASLLAERVLFFNKHQGLTDNIKTSRDFNVSEELPRNKYILEPNTIEYKKYLLQQFNLSSNE